MPVDKKPAAQALPARFEETSKQLLSRERGISHFGGKKGCRSVAYYPIAREAAKKIDWPAFSKDCQLGKFGVHAKHFDWVDFFAGAKNGVPADPYKFVDDMTVNGIVVSDDTAAGVQQVTSSLIPVAYAAASTAGVEDTDPPVEENPDGTGAGGGKQRPPGS